MGDAGLVRRQYGVECPFNLDVCDFTEASDEANRRFSLKTIIMPERLLLDTKRRIEMSPVVTFLSVCPRHPYRE